MSGGDFSNAIRAEGLRLQRVSPFPVDVSLSGRLPAARAVRLLRRLRAERSGDGPSVVAVDEEAVEEWRDEVVEGGTRWLEAAIQVLEPGAPEDAERFFRERQQVLRGFHESYRRALRRQMAELESLEQLPERPGSTGTEWYRDGRTVRIVVLACAPALVPLFLGFGGFNRCPLPVEHAVVQRLWHDSYGAEVVYLGRNSFELKVTRPPSTVDQLRRAAWTFFLYSGLELYHGNARLAAQAADRLRGHWTCWWD